MAIGSAPPPGERFIKNVIGSNGLLDTEFLNEWFARFKEETKTGLLAGYGYTCYVTPEQKEAFAKKIREEYCVHGTGCCSEH